MYKVQSIFLFILIVKVTGYLDDKDRNPQQSDEDLKPYIVIVLIIIGVIGPIITHYSKYLEITIGSTGNEFTMRDNTIENNDGIGPPAPHKNLNFKTYIMKIVRYCSFIVTYFSELLQFQKSAIYEIEFI